MTVDDYCNKIFEALKSAPETKRSQALMAMADRVPGSDMTMFSDALIITLSAAWTVADMPQREHNTRRGVGTRKRNRQPFGGKAA